MILGLIGASLWDAPIFFCRILSFHSDHGAVDDMLSAAIFYKAWCVTALTI